VSAEEYPAGWLTQFRRGIFAGLANIVVALSVTAAIALAAWLIPGPDTTTAVSAIKAACIVVLSGHLGGVKLNGTLVTLAPLLVTVGLAWLSGNGARRADSTSGFIGMCAGYGGGAAILASWARLGQTHAPVVRSALAALFFAVLVGGTARYLPVLGERLSDRWNRIGRAVLLAALGYLGCAAAIDAVVVAIHLHEIAALTQRVSPGAAGLPVALLGLAATPNAVMATVGYLAGPGFAVGSHTSISMFTVEHGRLPIFPLLAAVPTGQPSTVLGVLLAIITALLASALAYRQLRAGAGGRLVLLADVALTAGLSAVVLAVLVAAANGSAGDGTLQSIGAVWWLVLPCVLAGLAVGGVAWMVTDALVFARGVIEAADATKDDAGEADPSPRTVTARAS